MPLSVLYIGGTGQISLPCVEASVAAGHKVTVLNRGKTTRAAAEGRRDAGRRHERRRPTALSATGSFDVVAQFRLYTPDQMQRDIATFTGKTGQYVFISSASVYEKPVRHYMMTERTPKLESVLGIQPQQDRLRGAASRSGASSATRSSARATRCAPACRSRSAIPTTRIRRMIAGKPVIVAGDGSSLWTLTRSVDVARAVRRGCSAIPGRSTRISTSPPTAASPGTRSTRRSPAASASRRSTRMCRPRRWSAINKEWEGPLMGDKTWSALFDNSKVKASSGRSTRPRTSTKSSRSRSGTPRTRLKAPATAASDEEDGRSTGSSRRRRRCRSRPAKLTTGCNR